MSIFDFVLSVVKKELSHRDGNRVITPKNKIIPPEIHFHTYSGIVINNVLAFNNNVNNITDTPRDMMIVNAFFLLKPVSRVSEESDPPIITGRSGKIHGASTVSIPAIKEIIKSIILFYFRD
jgi:hypothetical protein